jgi:glycosyltransferase involved in cell wall biosynthesis
MCHNYYQNRGGEDEVFEVEGELLRENGHQVIQYSMHNDCIGQGNRLVTGLGASWNQASYNQIRALIKKEKPDLVHFYNTFPLISPSVYYAVKAVGLPLVQSLHNYRLLCLKATFYRNGSVCEDCLGKTLPFPGIRHACYRDSRLQSASVASMQVTHRLLKSWHKKVDLFLLGSTRFALDKFVQGGFSEDAFMLKPNFVFPDPGAGDGKGGYVLFVGRLDETKGIGDLLNAWQSKKLTIPLKIVGDGPMESLVKEAAQKLEQVEWLGRKSLTEVYDLMKEAKFLVFPSRWYEAMPRTIVDSLAVGTPVCAADIGAMHDLIDDGRSGLLFTPGDVDDLSEKVRYLFERPQLNKKMRGYARQSFLENFTAERNYDLIMQAYALATERNLK